MVVSADGLPIAVSDRLERTRADQLAATASCLASLPGWGPLL
jgi:predicted regulator of Ras-like GTPase activity (Roadblock/LC7/MglB family)